MHRTRVPLRDWFWAAYLVTTHTPGFSALPLQRQLGLRRYETAWAMLRRTGKRDEARAPLATAYQPVVKVAEDVSRPWGPLGNRPIP